MLPDMPGLRQPEQSSIPVTATQIDAEILAEVFMVYHGSNGTMTQALYDELAKLGALGAVAMNLFRACKCSASAKLYRGGNGQGSYRRQAYARKSWSIDNLSKALIEHADMLGIGWGWGIDNNAPGYINVLYVELPTGQISFHNDVRYVGPDYPKEWDGMRNQSVDRIVRFTTRVLQEARNGR